MDACITACESVGPWGQTLIVIAAFAWGQWKAWQAQKLTRELLETKAQLSLRPPPVHLIYSATPPGFPAVTDPPPAPPVEPPTDKE